MSLSETVRQYGGAFSCDCLADQIFDLEFLQDRALVEKDAIIAKRDDSLTRVRAWLDNCDGRYNKLEANTDAEIARKDKALKAIIETPGSAVRIATLALAEQSMDEIIKQRMGASLDTPSTPDELLTGCKKIDEGY